LNIIHFFTVVKRNIVGNILHPESGRLNLRLRSGS